MEEKHKERLAMISTVFNSSYFLGGGSGDESMRI